MVCDRVVCAFLLSLREVRGGKEGKGRTYAEVAVERKVLGDLVLELGTDSFPDVERVLHLLDGRHRCSCSKSCPLVLLWCGIRMAVPRGRGETERDIPFFP